MARFAAQVLARAGFEPVFAFYSTYSKTPQLSVPAFKLLQRQPGAQTTFDAQGCEQHAIGAWLPELEFTHYLPTRRWRALMESCDLFLAVSGNVLAATPFRLTGRPYFAWVATDWDGDRNDRVRHFPWWRKLLDRCVNAPVIRRLERHLLRGGRIVALSEHTAGMLQQRGAQQPTTLLPVPIELDLFAPRPDARVPGRIGFAGRLNDPRKNVALLLAAVAQLRAQGRDVHAVLMGDSPQASLKEAVARLGLAEHVSFHAELSRTAMRDMLQTLDVFVLPSHQEGLCISALEALACGVPVVSTRCGGPEEFVIPGVTGELVDATPTSMARAVADLIARPDVRERMSLAARRLVCERYGLSLAQAVFIRELEAAFPAFARSHAPLAHALEAT